MKKIIPIAVSVLMIGLVACEPEEVAFDPAADVFVITKTVATENEVDTVYGLALHAFANKPMQSVKVTSVDNTTYDLESYEGYPYDFYAQTEDDDFSAEMPESGAYSFNIVAQSGETSTLSDNLSDDVIYPTDTIKYAFDDAQNKMKLTWTEIEDADYLIVKMFEQDDDQVFQSSSLLGDKEEYTISASGSGWASDFQPADGATYIIQLDAFKYESGQNGVNLQAKSISLQEIVWGEE
ncbi:hypothetical protein [Sunxiuqinia dokdonensis]|uniref:Uncharacterized protein n=1 Tax=Sunxiuqinia dokdonensis TaxID=1409788 RepID=A0A0L8VCS8_9BACT|nr:hypothetical protein [Sunxiuqinia dokdonensis]KOH46269.1 hypothetical protein NC99_09340 [Sunxiuqinia dokdonensis]